MSGSAKKVSAMQTITPKPPAPSAWHGSWILYTWSLILTTFPKRSLHVSVRLPGAQAAAASARRAAGSVLNRGPRPSAMVG